TGEEAGAHADSDASEEIPRAASLLARGHWLPSRQRPAKTSAHGRQCGSWLGHTSVPGAADSIAARRSMARLARRAPSGPTVEPVGIRRSTLILRSAASPA